MTRLSRHFRVLGFCLSWVCFVPYSHAADPTDSPGESARFLTQTTFGPTSASITHLQNLPSFNAWLNEQFAMPASLSQEAYVRSRCPEVEGNPGCGQDTWVPSRHDQWWTNIIEGQDQLRQRVAFALSQIFVVSGKAPALSDTQFGLANYYDMLVQNAFGNYRTLLEKVTLHPVMGIYLSMVRNQKADPANNIRPDENYAREVLQLFSIGLHKLNLDGSLKLDANQHAIPTYGQNTIKEFARVFTGWNYAGIGWDDWFGDSDRTQPMTAVAQYHDTGEKHLLNGAVLPAGNSAEQDMTAALDNIFNHPNVGPFISKQLIQRLVTSNPTPAYVARVASAFNNNGSGVRGDLKAVVRAILLDAEARNGPTSLPDTFGKLREPLLRISHLYRAFKAQKRDGGEWNEYPGTAVYSFSGISTYHMEGDTGQGLLRSPSVFNFYLPDYSPSGEIRRAGLVAPEFQIVNENTVAAVANAINSSIRADSNASWTSPLDLSVEEAMVDDANAILDHLNLLIFSNQMSAGIRQILHDHLLDTSRWWGDTPEEERRNKVRDLISLSFMSPDYQIQR
ncbi:MAG: DUF1800 domain-containing protein [Gammaproteobacteria bacterium]|nr:MAG: DUF1800 domain-containing protein [Gammaproteobacteria bacterium]